MKFIIFVFSLVSCGQDVCNNETLGFCIEDPSNGSANVEWYSKAIHVVNDIAGKQFDQFDMESMTKEKGPFNVILEDGTFPYRGLTEEDGTVHVRDSSCSFPGINCLDQSYVLAHEVLHVISNYYLDVPLEANSEHDVENVFLIWALDNQKSLDNTVEFDVYWALVSYCDVDISSYYRFTDENPGICKQ